MTGSRSRALVGLVLLLVGLVGVVWSLPAAAVSRPETSPGSVAELTGGMDRAAVTLQASAPAMLPFGSTGLIDRRAWGDVDGDRVPDVVEDALCGTSTCATSWDDVDADGIPDWSELLACGDATCADARLDTDDDGIPDYVGQLLCGEQGCPRSTLLGDLDGDGVATWIEAVIAGDAFSATGAEDLNGDGVSDAAQLAECLVVRGGLASTGAGPWLWVFVALACLGAGQLLTGRSARPAAASGTGALATVGGDATGRDPRSTKAEGARA